MRRNDEIIFKDISFKDISKEEKWMLNNLVNRSACNNEEKFLRQPIKEVIKN